MSDSTPSNFNAATASPKQLQEALQTASPDEIIKKEMIRLGFWKEGQDTETPEVRALLDEISRLEQVLEDQKTALNDDTEILAIIRERRRQRMLDSLQQREERKVQKALERKERQEKWEAQLRADIHFLGHGFSNELQHKQSNETLLNQLDLPILHSAVDLSQHFQISVSKLYQHCKHEPVSAHIGYLHFSIPKKNGSLRHISAPREDLKSLQYWILHNILDKVPVSESAIGFCKGKSILDNARPHVGSAIVINMDLENFFPTISFERVRGVFRKMGYSGAISTILAMLCTEPVSTEIDYAGQKMYLLEPKRFLPQGAPTSPMITNILCQHLDARFNGYCEKTGWRYTRYADDLTFSHPSHEASIGKMLSMAQKIVKTENLVIHPDKTRVMRSGSCQEVTGIVVNEKLSINRKVIKNFRTLIFQIEKDGLEGKSWQGKSGVDLWPVLQGMAAYIAMVNPEKGQPLRDRVAELLKSHS